MTAPQSPPDQGRPAAGRRPWERPTVRLLGNIKDIVRGGNESTHKDRNNP
jgi:hypothetical protein